MKDERNRPFDIFCTGELLVDMISREFADSFDEASTYQCLQGGSPANLCMNMARLGNRTRLAASIGNDDLGGVLLHKVASTGVDTGCIRRVAVPTTIILVTRTKTVANFEAYRGADAQIAASQLTSRILGENRIFHTTCFALSKNPAQRNIMNAARTSARLGCQLSLDANYAAKIWPDQAEAQRLVHEFCQLGTILKVSEVDWERLYGEALTDAEKAAAHFIALGASTVCVTMGGEGAFVANRSEGHFLGARPVDVKDTTGAGDAFWSGFLTAWLDGHPPLHCAMAGRKMAELKISRFGPLPDQVDKSLIYTDFLEQ